VAAHRGQVRGHVLNAHQMQRRASAKDRRKDSRAAQLHRSTAHSSKNNQQR
jgi:hypothetical protein